MAHSVLHLVKPTLKNVARNYGVPGGIVVYDDYGGDTTPGVAGYVDTQLPLKDRIVLHNLNGHANVIKR